MTATLYQGSAMTTEDIFRAHNNERLIAMVNETDTIECLTVGLDGDWDLPLEMLPWISS